MLATRYARHMHDTDGPRSAWFQRVVALLLLAATAATAWRPQVDAFAETQIEAGLQRALVAFALARALNGVISVAQSTELALQPAGIGVAVNPGELLDPVNDLVEQFSTVMLVAAGSLGLQRLLVGISAWMPLQIAVIGTLAAWLALTFMTMPRVLRLARNTALLLLLLRFAVPASALASEAAYRVFLEPEYAASSAAIERAKDDLLAQSKEVEPEQPPAGLSLGERAQAWLDQKAKSLDVRRHLEALEVTATEITGHVVNLIAVFVVQTVVLPLLFLWLGWRTLLVMLPRALGRGAGD